MNIRELGPYWSLAFDIFVGAFFFLGGIVAVLAVKKRWEWLYYREFWYFERWAGREFMKFSTVVLGILFMVIGGYFLVKVGISIF